MPALAPVLDPAVFHPSPLGLVSPPVVAPLPYFPPDEPGDPLVPPLPATPRRFGRRVALIAAEALTHRPITHMGTAVVSSWDDPFGLEPSTIRAALSAEDPAWGLLGATSAVMRGRRRWRFPDDDGQLEWQVWDERRLCASGVTGSPAALDGGGVELVARGPEYVLSQRSVGAGGTIDLLDGRGSFPAPYLSAGWEFAALAPGFAQGFTTTEVFDGDRAMTLNGFGTAATPWVTVPAFTSNWSDIRSATMVLLPASQAGVFVETQVRLPGGAAVRADLTAAGKSQATTLAEREWQQVVGKAGLPPRDGSYQVRSVVTSLSSDPVILDRIVITQDYKVGAGAPLELSDYLERILVAAQQGRSGGHLGLYARKRSDSGVARRFSWSESDNPKALDMLQTVAGTPGAPDIWADPSWTVNAAKRRGQIRRDYALTDDIILAAPIQWDPSSRVRDLLVRTGFGAGATAAVIGYTGPPSPGRRRRRQEVFAPSELSFQAAEAWGEGRHQYGNQRHIALDVTVPYDVAEALATGDSLPCGTAQGILAEWGWTRVVNRTFYPQAETADLRCADDDTDAA